MTTFQNLDATVTAHTLVTADAAVLTFTDPEARLAQYLPGQFLTLNIDIEGTKHRRSYSLCAAPGVDAQAAVCVKRVEGGLVSNFILDHVKAGSTMNLFTAIGNFVCAPAPAAKRHIVLIGAGSGITPLWSIAKAILSQEPKSYVSLIYGNRTEDSIIFRAELADWQAKYSAHFRVVHTLTQAPAGWAGPSGRITGTLVEELLPHLQPLEDVEETRFYLCGPQAMADSVEHDLLATGVHKKKIFRESFFSDNLLEAEKLTTPGAVFEEETGPFTVQIKVDGKTYEVEVPVGETILQAALDLDIAMPYSCQAGLCTACRAKCHSGKIDMDETEGLVESDIKDGYVLLCVGHPRSANIMVEVG